MTVALLGMRPILDDLLNQQRQHRPNPRSLFPDLQWRPFTVAPVARRHMFGDRRMSPVAASTHVGGDAFAIKEDFDGACGHAGLDLAAGEAPRHRVMVVLDGNVIIEPDPATLPLSMDPRSIDSGLRFGASISSNS